MAMRLALVKSNAIDAKIRTSFDVTEQGRYTIGRDANCDWVLPDEGRTVSSRHCEIIFDGTSFTLRDLSTNGVFLNDARERVDRVHSLRADDVFSLGIYHVKVLLIDNVAGETKPDPAVVRTHANAVPVRGADPAAALALKRQAQQRKDDEPGQFVDDGMTVIRAAAPKSAPAEIGTIDEAAARDIPRMPDTPAAQGSAPGPWDMLDLPAPASSASASDRLHAAATGPSLSPGAHGFAAADPAEQVRSLGRLVLALTEAMKSLLEERTRMELALGSRRLASPARAGKAARAFAEPPERIVTQLLARGEDGDALVREAGAALLEHQRKLARAWRGAALRTASDLAPAALGAADAGDTLEHKARLWDGYTALWRVLDEDWTAGFVKAFDLNIAAAYDEGPADPKPPQARP